MWRQLSVRLLWGSVSGFLLSSLLAYAIFNHLLSNYLNQQLEEALTNEAVDVASVLERFTPSRQSREVARELSRYGHTHGIRRSFFRILTVEGRQIAASNLSHWQGLEKIDIPIKTREGVVFSFVEATLPTHPQGAKMIFFRHPEGFILHLGFDLGQTQAVLLRGRLLFAGIFFFVLATGSLWGYTAIRHTLRGMRTISDVAKGVTEEMNFARRVNTPTGIADTDQLAQAFNTMLDKIQVLIQSQKAIMDNIAHDIRSPVARMRSGAESALAHQENPEIAGHVIEECDRILNLVNTLLEISATEAGIVHWQVRAIKPAEIITEATDLFGPLIEERGLKLRTKLDSALTLTADEGVFQRIIANLLDNAIKYTPDHGQIDISLHAKESGIILVVADSGLGIPEEEIPSIFDRFYRCDASRSQIGSGLGLSFCKAAIKAMGGTIECESRLGVGTRFTLSFPGEHRVNAL